MENDIELLLNNKEREKIFDEIHILPYKVVLDAYLKAQRQKDKQRYEAQIIALQEIIQYLEQKGGKMKTIEEIKERIDFVEQVKYDVGFDQDVHGVEVDMSEIQQSNGYIKALKWVINDK